MLLTIVSTILMSVVIIKEVSSTGISDNFTLTKAKPSQEIIDSVPIDDRSYFIFYHLKIATQLLGRQDIVMIPRDATIPPDRETVFKQMNISPEFSLDLLEWTENDLLPQLSPPFINMQKKGGLERFNPNSNPLFCFPSGCIDPGDVGQVCCPF